MDKKIVSETETEEPEKIVKAKKIRTEVIEEKHICPICKQELVFTITNRYVNGKLSKSDKDDDNWHDPLECLQNAPNTLKTKSNVDSCKNCTHWAGNWNSSCNEMQDEFCNKHSRPMTKEEYDWIREIYPEKLADYGKIRAFKDLLWMDDLKYVCYEQDWCECYERK